MRSGRAVLGVLAGSLVLAAGCGATQSSLETVSTPMPAVVGSFEWTSVQVPYVLQNVVRAGDGFVALHGAAVGEGQEEAPAQWRVVTSPDGLTWTVAEGAPAGELVMWQEGGPWGAAVRVGSSDLLFTPDGVQWERSLLVDERGKPYAHLWDWAVGESGLVAIGTTSRGEREVLFSEDGKTWQRVDLGLPDSFDPVDVIAADDGFVLVTPGMEWAYSPDGLTWETSGELAGEGIFGGMQASTGWRDGFLILRGGSSGDYRAWMSGTGTSWSGSDVAGFDGLLGLGLDGSNLGLLFSGARPGTGGFDSPYDGVLMFSADGTTWESWSIQDILNHPWHMPWPPALGKDRIVIAQQDPPADGATQLPSTSTVWVGVPTAN
jgi:hypothetical protein